MSIKDNGVDEKVFESKVDYLAERVFEEQCTTANPKLPLVTELAEVNRAAYRGGKDKEVVSIRDSSFLHLVFLFIKGVVYAMLSLSNGFNYRKLNL